jgi:hypothetical protein
MDTMSEILDPMIFFICEFTSVIYLAKDACIQARLDLSLCKPGNCFCQLNPIIARLNHVFGKKINIHV